jgi:hypothetical protein
MLSAFPRACAVEHATHLPCCFLAIGEKASATAIQQLDEPGPVVRVEKGEGIFLRARVLERLADGAGQAVQLLKGVAEAAAPRGVAKLGRDVVGDVDMIKGHVEEPGLVVLRSLGDKVAGESGVTLGEVVEVGRRLHHGVLVEAGQLGGLGIRPLQQR